MASNAGKEPLKVVTWEEIDQRRPELLAELAKTQPDAFSTKHGRVIVDSTKITSRHDSGGDFVVLHGNEKIDLALLKGDAELIPIAEFSDVLSPSVSAQVLRAAESRGIKLAENPLPFKPEDLPLPHDFSSLARPARSSKTPMTHEQMDSALQEFIRLHPETASVNERGRVVVELNKAPGALSRDSGGNFTQARIGGKKVDIIQVFNTRAGHRGNNEYVLDGEPSRRIRDALNLPAEAIAHERGAPPSDGPDAKPEIGGQRNRSNRSAEGMEGVMEPVRGAAPQWAGRVEKIAGQEIATGERSVVETLDAAAKALTRLR